MKHRDICKELNAENKWRMVKPFIVPVGMIILAFPIVWVITLLADFIDYLFMNWTVQMGFFLFVGALALIIRREIRR